MGISFWQIAIVVVLVVLLFGRGKISSLMGDVAKGIKAYNPILAGQLSRNEIDECSKDPERNLNLIKKDNNVDIIMTLTTPNCPEAQTIPEKVADVVSLLKGVNEVKVEITWEPPWTQDNMTDAAKLELGLM